MPHKCLNCGKIYSDGEINLMNACTCGARFFLYSRTEEGFRTGGNLETAEEKAFGLKDEISVERMGETVLLRKKEFEGEEPAKEPKAPESKPEIKSMWEKEKKKAEKAPEIKPDAFAEEIKAEKAPELKIKTEKEEEKKKAEKVPEIKPDAFAEEIKAEKAPELKIKTEKEEEKKKPEVLPEAEKIPVSAGVKAEKEIPVVSSDEEDLEWLEKEFKLSEKGLVSLDVETLKILRKGKYQIDVASLMAGKPLVIETKKGVYYIHLPTAMRKKKKK